MDKLLRVAALATLVPVSGNAEPMPDFPDHASAQRITRHCLSVEYASALAGALGAKLANSSLEPGESKYSSQVNLKQPSDWVLRTVGGVKEAEAAFKTAIEWEPNWRSHGETYWAALLTDHTPYNVREGQILLDQTFACMAHFVSMADQQGSPPFTNQIKKVPFPD
ncbi:MAG: hypothetical protein JXR15_07050 [Shimia sp.]|uniref:hypothetical protein n=1 Tax=Shimia sp. TaxID=1954381 RepID=UPI003B8E94B7